MASFNGSNRKTNDAKNLAFGCNRQFTRRRRQECKIQRLVIETLLRLFQRTQLIKCGLAVQELRGDVEERKKKLPSRRVRRRNVPKWKSAERLFLLPTPIMLWRSRCRLCCVAGARKENRARDYSGQSFVSPPTDCPRLAHAPFRPHRKAANGSHWNSSTFFRGVVTTKLQNQG